MRSSNPALATNPFSGFGMVSESNAMTIRGTVGKTLILLALVLLPATLIWRQLIMSGYNQAVVQPWMMGGLFGGFILSLATIFKKNWAPITAPLYAVAQGLFLGGMSGLFEKELPRHRHAGSQFIHRHLTGHARCLSVRLDSSN